MSHIRSRKKKKSEWKWKQTVGGGLEHATSEWRTWFWCLCTTSPRAAGNLSYVYALHWTKSNFGAFKLKPRNPMHRLTAAIHRAKDNSSPMLTRTVRWIPWMSSGWRHVPTCSARAFGTHFISLLPHWKRACCSLICFLKMCWLFMECHVSDTIDTSLSLPLDL